MSIAGIAAPTQSGAFLFEHPTFGAPYLVGAQLGRKDRQFAYDWFDIVVSGHTWTVFVAYPRTYLQSFVRQSRNARGAYRSISGLGRAAVRTQITTGAGWTGAGRCSFGTNPSSSPDTSFQIDVPAGLNVTSCWVYSATPNPSLAAQTALVSALRSAVEGYVGT